MMDRLRAWSFAHPKARKVLREGWGLSRRAARATHVPVPFDPAEFADLRRVSATREATPVASTNPPSRRILFLSMRGWSTHVMWEVTMAYAVELRGATAIFATCGGRLPICDAANVHSAPPMPCVSCGEYAETALRTAGFDPLTLRDLVDVRAETAAARRRIESIGSVRECEAFVDDGLPVGRLVRISVAWFLARGTLPETPQIIDTYRRFLVSGQVLHRAFRALIERVRPDRIVLLNGTFFAESILFELARRHAIGVTSYERGFNTDSVVVTPDRPAADLMVDDTFWREAAERPLSDEDDAALDRILSERTRGERLPDNFWQDRVEGVDRVRAELQLDPHRPLVVLFSNILWDSAVQGKDIAYPSMSDWIIDAIAGFASRPDHDLVVRLHPAETRLVNHPTVERMGDVISRRFPELPPNVRVVQPENPLSSYSLMEAASIGLVYTSTAGLEMAARGIPVVVAAETHYRNRGFSDDVSSANDFWGVIDGLRTTPLNAAQREQRRQLARRYAALFLLRFMQPLDLVHEVSRGRPRLAFDDVGQLAAGRDPALDRIASGIIDGEPVVAATSGRT